MKKILLIWLISAISFSLNAQETFTISADGTTFNPSILNVQPGNNVQFNTGSEHPVLQVSQSTWNSNGSTPLQGGFSFPSGSGIFNPNTTGTFYYICTVHIGSGMKGTITVSESTSTETFSIKESFRVFPNPANDYIKIRNSADLPVHEIKIIDMSGRTLLSLNEGYSTDEFFQIGIKHLNKGLYFISIELADTRLTRKFMKQ